MAGDGPWPPGHMRGRPSGGRAGSSDEPAANGGGEGLRSWGVGRGAVGVLGGGAGGQQEKEQRRQWSSSTTAMAAARWHARRRAVGAREAMGSQRE